MEERNYQRIKENKIGKLSKQWTNEGGGGELKEENEETLWNFKNSKTMNKLEFRMKEKSEIGNQ